MVKRKAFQAVINAAQELRKLGGTTAERMARAAEQGYGNTFYHATDKDFTEFMPSGWRGTNSFAPTPEGAMRGANSGGAEHVAIAGAGNPNTIYPVMLRGKIYGQDTPPDWWLPESVTYGEYRDILAKNKELPIPDEIAAQLNQNQIEQLQYMRRNDALNNYKEGVPESEWGKYAVYDDKGMVIDTSADMPMKLATEYAPPKPFMYTDIEGPQGYKSSWVDDYPGDRRDLLQKLGYTGARVDDEGGKSISMFDPSAIRSVNADFNPEYRDSPNLLASVAGAMPYAAGAAALLAGVAPEQAEAGPLQTLGRAAPYLTSAALGGAAALQSGDAEASFIGTLAKTFPHDMLGMARKMKDYGLSRAEIWKKTGIDLDNVDGLPRSELPDNPQGINQKGVDAIRGYGRRTQRTVNDQPNLFAAYPDMGGMTTGYDVGRGYLGAYDPVNDAIEHSPEALNVVRDRKRGQWRDALAGVNSSNAHELQHAIQEREGFARGGNTEMFAREKREAEQEITALNGTLSRLSRFKEEALARGDAKAVEEIEKDYEYFMGVKLNNLVPQAQIDPMDSYRRLAGEAEARNVEARLNMTAAERRATPPWETLDVPESEQIVRMRGNADPRLLAGAAAATGAGMYAASDAQAFDESRYSDTMQRTQAALNKIGEFQAKRAGKRGAMDIMKLELQTLLKGANEVANDVIFPALDKPMQGYLGLSEVFGSLAQGRGFDTAMQRGAQVATQPVDETTYNMGGTVTDTLSPYVPAPVAAGAGALTHAGALLASPF